MRLPVKPNIHANTPEGFPNLFSEVVASGAVEFAVDRSAMRQDIHRRQGGRPPKGGVSRSYGFLPYGAPAQGRASHSGLRNAGLATLRQPHGGRYGGAAPSSSRAGPIQAV